jgi:gold/copper resistance efflux pump
MKFARIFIDRPIVAIVLSLLILLAGLASMGRLPLTEYPNVMPPTVNVIAAYPGANPAVIADTVATPLETELNGLAGLQYMGSQSTGDGKYTLRLTFEQGIDPARAETEVQNRVSRALPRLPAEVQRIGVVSEKVSPDMLMVVHLVSPGNRYDLLHLSNFAQLNIRDTLLRVPGVQSVAVWGAGEYSLRVWLDPERMLAYGLTAGDVVAAIREQNMQVAAGSVGQPDARARQQLPLSVTGRLTSLEAFGDIVVRTGAQGEQLKLSSVARIELGASQYSLRSLLDNQPAVALQITQTSSASALQVASAVREAMQTMQKDFPQGIEHRVAYDPTLFVKASISNVLQTLAEAIVLVVLVVLLFLQNWRASLIPIAAVPVSLVGTLAAMQLFGFSLNTLSLFGLVLSIGIVVDDAIVVVENVERHLADGLTPRDAALRAMQEVTGPILAITAVLAAVFIPTAFMGGLSGQFYRQFALTIAISTVLSAINSLTLSPALAAMLLKPHAVQAPRNALTRWFGAFNRGFDALADRYAAFTGKGVRRSARLLLIYGALVVLTVIAFRATPAGFVPAQDKYFLVGIVQLPPGASLDRTEAVTREMTRITLDQPGVESVVAFPGLSINGFVNSPSAAVVFAMLDPFEQRKEKSLGAGAIAGTLNGKFGAIDEGFVAIFPPPPVPGLGQTGGFKLQIQDKARLGPQELEKALQRVMGAAAKDQRLAGLMSGYQAQVPQLSAEIDREKAKAMGVPLNALAEAMQVYLGSLYVNDFNYLGRAWQVNVQADPSFRADADSVSRLWTRNSTGQMVPLASLVNTRETTGPDPISRYNGFASADLSGGPAPGVSAGDAVAAMEQILARELPEGFGYEWTDLTYQQMRDGSSGLLAFPLAVGLAFLILAAMYGSWALPLSVLAIVPTVLLGALAGVWVTRGDNNLFTQIAFVVLIGLATKNSILIVEFARRLQQEGLSAVDAVIRAARMRLRPILMTSLAFVMGVLPLVFASGAGAEMRQAVGVAVFAGMLAVTVAGLLFTPVFYVLLQRGRIAQSTETAAEAA